MQKASSSAGGTSPILLVTADDRTGALEAGGACADLGFAVRLVTSPDADDDCAVIDLDSRHCQPDEAMRRTERAHRRAARFRCHKMDSGLRGNWPHEVRALVGAGHRVGVLASFPDAGRRCVDGVVFIHDLPVTESAFGRDPRNRVFSDRPLDYLVAAGCGDALAKGDLVVLDAGDNDELRTAAARCREQNRMLVGTTGGIGAYAATLRGRRASAPLPPLKRPALVVCGSLHPLSRAQIAALNCPLVGPADEERAVALLAKGSDVVLATEPKATAISTVEADTVAAELATATWRWLARSRASTLIVLGGDTAAAILGSRTLTVYGCVDTGVPLCRGDDDRLSIVTKGGGIGEPQTLVNLLS